MNERLKYMGRLQEKELELKKKALAMKSAIEVMRDMLDPFEDLEELKTEAIAEEALRLANLQIEYREIKSEIKAIRKVLGR